MKLIFGNKYKWKHDIQVLTYIGKKGGWNQFTLSSNVYCEVLDSDLHLMEEVKCNEVILK